MIIFNKRTKIFNKIQEKTVIIIRIHIRLMCDYNIKIFDNLNTILDKDVYFIDNFNLYKNASQ